MKICYTNFHQADGGGHTTYVLSLARALSSRHEICVVAPRTSRLYQEAGQIPGVHRFALGFSSRLLGMLREALRLRALLRRERFDVVHVNGSADHRCVTLAALDLGPQSPHVVYTKHNDYPVAGIGNWLRARLMTDRVICVSRDTRRRLEHSPYSRCGLCVVCNGVSVARYAPWDAAEAARMRRQLVPAQAPEDALVLGSNAGTPWYKGWLDMVRAVASLPEPLRRRTFVLLAGQPLKVWQHAEIEALGMSGQVIHAGLLHDVRPFIAAIDVGFVLSHKVETISFACREMMAMGKPVIVSDHGGLIENVTPGRDGWIVPRRSPAAVAAVLREIHAHRDRLAGMGEAARAKSVAEFGLDRFVRSTERVYRELLA